MTDTSRHRHPIPPEWKAASAEPSGVHIRTRPVVHGNACADAVRSNRPRSAAAMASATQSTRRYRVSDRRGLTALWRPRPFHHPRSICAHTSLSVATMNKRLVKSFSLLPSSSSLSHVTHVNIGSSARCYRLSPHPVVRQKRRLPVSRLQARGFFGRPVLRARSANLIPLKYAQPTH